VKAADLETLTPSLKNTTSEQNVDIEHSIGKKSPKRKSSSSSLQNANPQTIVDKTSKVETGWFYNLFSFFAAFVVYLAFCLKVGTIFTIFKLTVIVCRVSSLSLEGVSHQN
jgi:hypothetical protein